MRRVGTQMQTHVYLFTTVLQSRQRYGVWTMLALISLLTASVSSHPNSATDCVVSPLACIARSCRHSASPGGVRHESALQVLIYSLNLRNRWRFRHIPGPTPAWLAGNLRQVSKQLVTCSCIACCAASAILASCSCTFSQYFKCS